MLAKEIRELSDEIYGDVVRIRRYLHQNPELSFEEKNTSELVCRQLDQWGIPYEKNIGGYGVVGSIEGDPGGDNVVALRADMDALPIQEENKVSYASRIPGVMHACGHDVHTSSLLGTAYILQQARHQFSGQVKLIFQPAEERLPGGASLMIKEGVLQNPAPKSILAQHVHPPLDTGKVGFRPGKYMASTDEIYLTVSGRGGHAAMPHQTIDTTLATAHIIVALQQIISRRSDPAIPSVLTLGKIESEGGSTNIIPGRVNVEGTFRSMDEEWRYKAHRLIKDTALYTARALGAEVEIEIKIGYPYLFNDPGTTQRMKEAAIEFLGKEQVEDLPIRMTSEDFAYYSHEIKACFYRLGIHTPGKKSRAQLHGPTFDVDEECLETSVGLMAHLAVIEMAANQ